jgi:hypothetical protein
MQPPMECQRELAPVSTYFLLLIVSLITVFFLFRCLKHVVNLANIAVMGHITKVAVIENTNTIWEYDPGLPDNRVLGGSLDVVAILQTLVIKVCSQ